MSNIDETCINTIKFLAVDAVEKAKSGHPGMPMGDADMAYVLWTKVMRHNPKNPAWEGRDRFVLSAGHGSALLYSLLHLTGYDISLEDIKNFRQWGSPTAGHPERELKHGIEMTTGPLGQGIGTGVGMAMAQKFLKETYGGDLFDYNIYAIAGDGCMMEGISQESASLAGHLKLGSLIYLYSDNHISIEGKTEITFTDDTKARFESMNWHVIKLDEKDSYDLQKIEDAMNEAKNEKSKPSLIMIRTHIGHGSPKNEDNASCHGAPLGADEIKVTKEKAGWEQKDFYVPEEAKEEYKKVAKKGQELEDEWNKKFVEFKATDSYKDFQSIDLKNVDFESLTKFTKEDGKIATRAASGKIVNELSDLLPCLVGGSADLAPSNNTYLKGKPDYTDEHCGRNIHYGVREHAMGTAMNGLALSNRIIPFGGTFLVFFDYLKPAIRLAALMETQAIYVFTHDSIGLGEDGPTHQPIEHLMALRNIPNVRVIRPMDANETREAWISAIKNKKGPTALILTRQGLPIVNRDKDVFESEEELHKGAYVLSQTNHKPEIILMATGSEVELALQAKEGLEHKGKSVRVVSMPSFELFEAQSNDYKEEVLPSSITKRVSIEAGTTLGWHRYVGLNGITIGIDRFGASAPANILFEKFGFTKDNVVEKAMSLF